jgi:hypothetical protein
MTTPWLALLGTAVMIALAVLVDTSPPPERRQ